MAEKPASNAETARTKPKSIWDNDLPAGDSPPLPSWPLKAAVVLYSLWMVFLIAMTILRLTTN